MPAILTYYIREGVLVGLLNEKMIHVLALSGGGGGSTSRTGAHAGRRGSTKQQMSAIAVNNPYAEGLREEGALNSPKHIHGGPIPPGKYLVHKPGDHPRLGLSARLTNPHQRPGGRSGFFIHGRGPHGSDGCIVPLDKHEFAALMDGLSQSHGGTLIVQETEDGTRYV